MDRPTVPLEFAEVFDAGIEPRTFAPAATLKELEIDAEEPARPYRQFEKLEELNGELRKDVGLFEFFNVPLAKGARTTEADRLGIVRTEILEENGERIAKAFNSAGEVVGVRKLLASGLLE